MFEYGIMVQGRAWMDMLMQMCKQRLAAKDLDDWEQKRVERLKGEHDGIL